MPFRVRDMLTEIGLDTITYPLPSAGREMPLPPDSPEQAAPAAATEPEAPSPELLQRSSAEAETIEIPEPVEREADHVPSEEQWGGPEQRPTSDPLPMALPPLARTETDDHEFSVAEAERLPTAGASGLEVPSWPPLERELVPDGPPAAPGTGPRPPDGERDMVLPPAGIERSGAAPAAPEGAVVRRPAAGQEAPTIAGLGGGSEAEPPAPDAFWPTPQGGVGTADHDSQPALSLGDTAVEGAAGRMDSKRRRELAEIEALVQRTRRHELRIASGR